MNIASANGEAGSSPATERLETEPNSTKLTRANAGSDTSVHVILPNQLRIAVTMLREALEELIDE